LPIIDNKGAFWVREKLKIGPEGGERVSRPLAGTKESSLKGEVLGD